MKPIAKNLLEKNDFGDQSRKCETLAGFRQNNCLFMQPIQTKITHFKISREKKMNFANIL